jgi:RNA polymerase sigma factor (sigma-70 family)
MIFEHLEEEFDKPTFKVWCMPEYDDPKLEKEIMGDMPNYDIYISNKNNIQKEINKVQPELRQFYCEPLLNTEQEFHLFRKLNFMKYKAKKYYSWYKISKSKKLKDIIMSFINEIPVTRNLIVCCNTRLAALVIKKRKDYYNNNINVLLSDCFINIMKAVDGFDFTRKNQFGRTNKFSTYCTWVLMNNSLRDHSSDRKFYDKFASNMDDTTFGEKIDEKESCAHNQLEHNESVNSDVNKVLNILKDTHPREVYILKNYYGINQENRKTLKEISEELGLTKERVRQLREHSLVHIQQLISQGKLTLSNVVF